MVKQCKRNHHPCFNICEHGLPLPHKKTMRFCSVLMLFGICAFTAIGTFRTIYINSKYFYCKEGNISLLIFSKWCVVATKI